MQALAATEKRNQEITQQSRSWQTQVPGLQKELKEAKETLTTLTKDLKDSQDAVKELAANLAEREEELQKVQGRVKEFSREGVMLTPRPDWENGLGAKNDGLEAEGRFEWGEGTTCDRVIAVRSSCIVLCATVYMLLL